MRSLFGKKKFRVSAKLGEHAFQVNGSLSDKRAGEKYMFFTPGQTEGLRSQR